jgi:hypothetical protein
MQRRFLAHTRTWAHGIPGEIKEEVRPGSMKYDRRAKTPFLGSRVHHQ